MRDKRNGLWKGIVIFSCSAALCACAQLSALTESTDSISVDGLTEVGSQSPVKDLKVTRVIGASGDLVKAVSLSDKDIRSMAKQMARYSDSQNNVAPLTSVASQRLKALTSPHLEEDELSLNFKVYESEEVNAFALPDGSIRVYSGLMNGMNDDELRSVIGHEIGHVKLGHSKKEMQLAYTTSAAVKGALSTVSGSNLALPSKILAELVQKVVGAQFSQSQELDADTYGLQFMQKHQYPQKASASALRKLAALAGDHTLLSSHPDPEDRAKRIEERIGIEVEESVVVTNEAGDTLLTSGEKRANTATQFTQTNQTTAKNAAGSEPQGDTGIPAQTIKEHNQNLKRGWYVDGGAFPDRIDATVLATNLNDGKLIVHVSPVKSDGIKSYIVLVGPFTEEQFAKNTADELIEDNLITKSVRVINIQ